MTYNVAVIHNTHSAQLISCIVERGTRIHLIFIENAKNVPLQEMRVLSSSGALIFNRKNRALVSMIRILVCIYARLQNDSLCFISNYSRYGSLVWRFFFKRRIVTLDEGAYNWASTMTERVNSRKGTSKLYGFVFSLFGLSNDLEFCLNSARHYSYLKIGPLAHGCNFVTLDFRCYLKLIMRYDRDRIMRVLDLLRSLGVRDGTKVVIFARTSIDSHFSASSLERLKRRVKADVLIDRPHPERLSEPSLFDEISGEVLCHCVRLLTNDLVIVSTTSSLLFSTLWMDKVQRFTVTQPVDDVFGRLCKQNGIGYLECCLQHP